MTWFEELTGFREISPSQVRKNITVDGEILKSHVNGREMACGRLETPSLAELRERPDVDWCAASCHNAAELRRAEQLGCDFALLSPVLATQSHPGAPHLGWENFAAIAAGSSIPVYALGGLTHDDMHTAWQHGAHGISLLRQAW